MLDKRLLLQSIQNKVQTTNRNGEYVPHIQNEGVLDYLGDTASGIYRSVVGETDAEKKKREEEQASNIAKRREELRAKGAPTTVEAPPATQTAIANTTVSKVADPKDSISWRGAVGYGADETGAQNSEAMKRAQERLTSMVKSGELKGRDAAEYRDQLMKRFVAAQQERNSLEFENDLESKAQNLGLLAQFLDPTGKASMVALGSAAAKKALYGNEGNLLGKQNYNDEMKMAALNIVAPAAIRAAGKGIGLVGQGTASAAKAIAPEATARVLGLSQTAINAVKTGATNLGNRTVGQAVTKALSIPGNPLTGAVGAYGEYERIKDREDIGTLGKIGHVLAADFAAGKLGNVLNTVPGLGKVVADIPGSIPYNLGKVTGMAGRGAAKAAKATARAAAEGSAQAGLGNIDVPTAFSSAREMDNAARGIIDGEYTIIPEPAPREPWRSGGANEVQRGPVQGTGNELAVVNAPKAAEPVAPTRFSSRDRLRYGKTKSASDIAREQEAMLGRSNSEAPAASEAPATVAKRAAEARSSLGGRRVRGPQMAAKALRPDWSWFSSRPEEPARPRPEEPRPPEENVKQEKEKDKLPPYNPFKNSEGGQNRTIERPEDLGLNLAKLIMGDPGEVAKARTTVHKKGGQHEEELLGRESHPFFNIPLHLAPLQRRSSDAAKAGLPI
jgi:polyhydroxyalkanoate synthesis regulator phasin